MTNPEVSIILPVYKNRDTVRYLHQQLSNVLAGISLEFVFVEDACPENSFEVLEQLAAEDERVTVLALAKNMGQQRAVLTGLQNTQGAIAVIMDADLQDPPNAVPKLLEKLAEGYDVVFGGRAGSYQVGHRLLTSRLYKWTLRLLLNVPANAGLFLAMRSPHIPDLLAIPTENPHLVAMIGALKLRNISIPVVRDTRPVGGSAYTSWMRLKIGLGAAYWAFQWRLGFRKAPRKKQEYPIKKLIPSKYYGKEK